MKALFLLENDPCSLNGGTDRVTLSVASFLRGEGVGCSLAYFRGCRLSSSSFPGDRMPVSEIMEKGFSEFDAIICNLSDIGIKQKYIRNLYEAAQQSGVLFVSCFHQMPGEDLIGSDIKTALRHFVRGGDMGLNLKMLALSILPKRLVRIIFADKIRSKYLLTYENCDKLLLHCRKACRMYADLCGRNKVDEKFSVMPNALSFDAFYDSGNLVSKRKMVLVVARMEERQKRISMAFRIWHSVKKDPLFSEWKLLIVGDGPDSDYYQKMVRRFGLSGSVNFVGKTDPRPYYNEASVFLMTSAFEAWGLTITESQQFGCVPIAFDTYPSLREIIIDGRNGIIVKENDNDGYASALKQLMSDGEYRNALACNAINDSHRFESSALASKWMELIDCHG